MNNIKSAVTKPAINKLLGERYFNKDESRWEDIAKRITWILPEIEQDVIDMKFIPSSPTLMNGNNPYTTGTMSSCFTMGISDSMEGIFDAVKESALVTKAAGGVGYDFSALRGSSELVKGIDANSSGPLPFINVFSNVLDGIRQGGKRRGAGMAMLSIDHSNILDFINAKSEPGKFERFNFSVRVTDKFYEQLETSPNSVWNVKATVSGEESPLKDKDGKEVTVKQLWDLIIDRSHSSAEPGIFNSDIAFRQCSVTNLDKQVLSNPCVTGDTLILTDKGNIRIDSMIGTKVNVWNGEEFSEVEPKITGENQNIIDFEFEDGTKLSTTAYHGFLIWNDPADNSKVYSTKEAGDVLIGDICKKYNTASKKFELISVTNKSLRRDLEPFVYCFNEPKLHRGVFNGVLTKQCAEYISIPFGSCNLGSINLSKLVKDKQFDWDEFESLIVKATKYLDAVLEVNNFPIQKIKDVTLKIRPLGLGYMGIAHALYKMNIPYSSKEGLNFIHDITRYLTLRSMKQSVEVSKEKGAYPAFDYDTYVKANARFLTEDSFRNINVKQLKSDIQKTGIRNSCTTSVAPTGCLHEDTRILTNIGLVKIKDLLDVKPIAGDFDNSIKSKNIYAYDTHGPTKITSFYTKGEDKGYKITLDDGRSLKMSDTHRVKVISPEGDIVWKYAPELTKKDIIVSQIQSKFIDIPHIKLNTEITSLHHSASKTVTLPKYLTPEVAEFIGIYIGDGSLKFRSSNGKFDALRFPVFGDDIDLLNYFTEKYNSLFNIVSKITKCKNKNMFEIYGHSINMGNWFMLNGFSKKNNITSSKTCHDHEIHVPELIFKSSADVKRAFLRGLFEADGCISGKSMTISLSSKHKCLVTEVQELLWSIGVQSYISKISKLMRISSFGGDIYALTIRNKKSKEIFHRDINFISNRKKTKLNDGVIALTQDHNELFTTRDKLIDIKNEIIDKLGNKSKLYSQIIQVLRKNKTPETNIYFISRGTLTTFINNGINVRDHLGYNIDDIAMNTIGSIDQEKFMMYDIEVANKEHTYITANGIINHNTVSYLCEASSGIEPVFALTYMRKIEKENKVQEVVYLSDPVFEEFLKNNFTQGQALAIQKNVAENEGSCQKSPHMTDDQKKVFVVAADISPMDHLEALARAAVNSATSVSKTINMPENISKEEVAKVYIAAHKKGIIGTTVYRNNSRAGVLVHSINDRPQDIVYHNSPKRPKIVECDVHRTSYKGEKWVAFVGMYKDKPFEIFCGKVDEVALSKHIEKGSIVKVASGHYSFMHDDEILFKDISKTFNNLEHDAFARIISSELRGGTRIEHICDTLSKSRGDITSFSKVLARILKQYIKDGADASGKCETCGSKLIYVDGCVKCSNPECSYSKCG